MAKKKAAFNFGWYNSVRNMVEDLIAEWKKSGDIEGGVSRLSYNEAGVPLVEGIAVAVKENAYEATDAMQKAMDEIKIKLNTGAISTQEYYKYMEFYRDSFLEKGSLSWWQYTEKIMDFESSLNESLKKELDMRKENIVFAYSQILSEAGNEISALLKLEEKTREKLSSFSDKYLSKTITFKNAGESFLKDGIWHPAGDLTYTSYSADNLKNASEFLRQYGENLAAIKNMNGVPEEFFNMLRSMSIEEGMEMSSYLLSADEEDFHNYINSWTQLQTEINKTTSSLLSDDITRILSSFSEVGTNLKADLKEALAALPEEFFAGGELSGDAFSKGFLSKLDFVESAIDDLEHRYSTVSSVTYNNPSYNFYSSGDSVAEQLEAARNAETVNKLRE